MSWISILSFLVILTVVCHGHSQNNEIDNGKEKLDMKANSLMDMLKKDNEELRQSIALMKAELSSAMNQMKELISFAKQQMEIKSQEPVKPDDKFVEVVPKSTDKMLLLVGRARIVNGRIEYSNETIALYNGTWVRKSPFPGELEDMTVLQLTSGDVIAVGRKIDNQDSDKSFIYRVDEDRWDNGPSMNFRRHDHCSVISGSKIYAIGGMSETNRTLRSMEVCDTKGDPKCKPLSPMGTPRHNAKAVIYNGDLYVTGGINVISILNSCEKYNFKLDKWEDVPDTIHPRFGHGLVTFNGKIYAIGGLIYDSFERHRITFKALKSVESYNGYEWVEEPSLNEARVPAAVGVIGQNIYVVGGGSQYSLDHDSNWQHNPVMSVEIFDLETSKWRFVNVTGTSPLPLGDSGAVVVDLN